MEEYMMDSHPWLKFGVQLPLITSRLTPGSQNAVEYLRIISLDLARMSGFTCPYFLVKLQIFYCETQENLG